MSRRCFGPVTVPDGELWVMGDHRSDSADSSYQCQGMPASSGAICQGPIPVDNVVGKAIVDRDATVPVGHHRQPGHRSGQPGQLIMVSPAAESAAGKGTAPRRHRRLAAMDEVGRGALAGPVTVGVVVVTAAIGRVPPGLADSKLLTPAAREALVRPIRRWVTEYAVGHASPAEIDTIGIIAALRTAGRRALGALSGPVDAVLLDGNHNYLSDPAVLAAAVRRSAAVRRRPVPTGPVEPRVHVRIKADLTCAAVAGASVLAKTERDRLLVELSPLHPRYNFAREQGLRHPGARRGAARARAVTGASPQLAAARGGTGPVLRVG